MSLPSQDHGHAPASLCEFGLGLKSAWKIPIFYRSFTAPATTVNTTEREPDGRAYCSGLDVSRTGLGRYYLCAEAGGTNGWLRVCLFPAGFRGDHLGWAGALRRRCTVAAGRRVDRACAGRPGATC